MRQRIERYEIDVAWSDEDGCFVARIAGLPFTSAHGDGYEEALANTQEAIEATLAALRETGA